MRCDDVRSLVSIYSWGWRNGTEDVVFGDEELGVCKSFLLVMKKDEKT